jgi:hypothetical protein
VPIIIEGTRCPNGFITGGGSLDVHYLPAIYPTHVFPVPRAMGQGMNPGMNPGMSTPINVVSVEDITDDEPLKPKSANSLPKSTSSIPEKPILSSTNIEILKMQTESQMQAFLSGLDMAKKQTIDYAQLQRQEWMNDKFLNPHLGSGSIEAN